MATSNPGLAREILAASLSSGIATSDAVALAEIRETARSAFVTAATPLVREIRRLRSESTVASTAAAMARNGPRVAGLFLSGLGISAALLGDDRAGHFIAIASALAT